MMEGTIEPVSRSQPITPFEAYAKDVRDSHADTKVLDARVERLEIRAAAV